jgi:hypothetical protein
MTFSFRSHPAQFNGAGGGLSNLVYAHNPTNDVLGFPQTGNAAQFITSDAELALKAILISVKPCRVKWKSIW